METVLMRKLGQTKGVAITSLDEGDAIVENREPIPIDSRQAADKCAYPFVRYPFFFRAVSRLKTGSAPGSTSDQMVSRRPMLQISR